MNIKSFGGITSAPFDLAAALSGAPVVTADHLHVTDLRHYPADEDGPEQVTGDNGYYRIVCDADGRATSSDRDLNSFRMLVG